LELGLTGQFPALDHREHARATIIGFFRALVLATVMNLIHRALEHGHLSFDDLAPVAETAHTEVARLLSDLQTFLELHGSEGKHRTKPRRNSTSLKSWIRSHTGK
jgi:hypothetical protein